MFGLLYWYALYPVHALIFSGLIRRVGEQTCRLLLPIVGALLLTMNTHAADKIIFNFQTVTNSAAWQVVNDDVMGGVSTSDFRVTNGAAVFQGEVSLANNGGFASVRSLPASHELAGCDFFRNVGADIRHGGDRAYYSIHNDYVQMPPFETFRDAESYYATLAHETTHWTCHPIALTGNSVVSAGATKAMPPKNSSPNWDQHSSPPISVSRPSRAKTMPRTSPTG